MKTAPGREDAEPILNLVALQGSDTETHSRH